MWQLKRRNRIHQHSKRGIQLCYLVPNPEEILETDAEAVASIRQLGDQTTLETIQILIEQLSSIGRAFHDALNKQVFLESILLKAMREAHAVKILNRKKFKNQRFRNWKLRFRQPRKKNLRKPFLRQLWRKLRCQPKTLNFRRRKHR